MLALALVGVGADVALAPAPAEAHLAKWGSWEITHRNLMKLFPDADPNAWRIKRYQFSAKARDFMAPHFERIERGFEALNVLPCQLFWGWKEPQPED